MAKSAYSLLRFNIEERAYENISAKYKISLTEKSWKFWNV